MTVVAVNMFGDEYTKLRRMLLYYERFRARVLIMCIATCALAYLRWAGLPGPVAEDDARSSYSNTRF